MKKSNYYFLVFFIIFILLLNNTIFAADKADDLNNKLDQFVSEKQKELEIYGIQAAVRSGNFYWQGESGYLGPDKKVSLQEDHIMRTGSVTKNFTAALILKLAEEGKISLNDRLSEWFPEFPKSKEITLRQLLNHSSGIYSYTENLWLTLETALRSKKRWTAAEILEKTYDKEFYFNPGEGYYYSNTNYLILGLIAEKVSGENLKNLYRNYIFEPLKLKNTYFVPYEGIPQSLITGYDRDVLPFGEHEMTAEKNAFATLGYSAGALVSTASDLRKWIDALFRSSFLSDKSLNEMMDFLEVEDGDLEKELGYGLGLRVLEIDEQILYGHTGTIPGFGAAVFYCPEKDYSLAVMSNISVFDQVNVINDLVKIISLEE